jgi:hypothetical protein
MDLCWDNIYINVMSVDAQMNIYQLIA